MDGLEGITRDLPRISLPIARARRIYYAETVAKKLEKLPAGNDYGTLRATYERMLEKGPERFQVKPSGIPAMQHLYDELPNFHEPLDDIKRQLALTDGTDDPIQINPILLLGPPGVGKTHFGTRVAELLGTGMDFTSMSSTTAGWILSGASSQWRGARPGKVFQTLVDGQYANPVMVIDEIDKARNEQAYDPLGALYALLEYDTAQEFVDEFAEVAVDASQLVVVLTANNCDLIPEPILNRANIYEINSPNNDQGRTIAGNIYRQIRDGHDWGTRFDERATDQVLDFLAKCIPREMKRLLKAAFGNAKLDGRYTLEVKDFPAPSDRRRPMGFVQ